MTSMDRQYTWSVADFVRERLGLHTPLSIQKLAEATEKSGGRCVPISTPDSPDGDFDAYIRTFDDSSEVYFEIVYAEWKSPPRILFSIAHELGHFFLHILDDNGSVTKDTCIYRNLQASTQEWEANEFAAELLMPKDEFISTCLQELKKNENQISRDIDVNNIAHHFGVSTQAATVRGQILHLW